ncbi:MAG: beta-galactosidase [Chthoniobacteraceae bacterium]
MKLLPLLLIATTIFAFPFARADEGGKFTDPNRIRYDRQCLTIDGKDTFIYSGAFHYFRCPKELWPDRFQKIKEAGFNAVETYAAWNWHEQEMPASVNDFSKITDLQDLDDWMTMAEQFGFYIIIRPGPYICAEWDNGGFPRWLTARKQPTGWKGPGPWLRSDAQDYLAWCKHWYDAVCPIIAKHQITHKEPGQPGVILFQIENEYNYWKAPDDVKVRDLTALANYAHADGIDVPLFTCNTRQIRGQKDGPLRSIFDSWNFYPRWNVQKDLTTQLTKLRAEQPDAMLMSMELQAGWFAGVGGKLSEFQDGVNAAQIQNLTLFAWQMGETLTNYYMLFGGTNFDDWSSRQLITSYDYNAPIREHGGVDARYQRVWALGRMIREHGAKLVRAEAVPIEATVSDKDVQVAERRAPDGSRYLFVRTDNHDHPRNGQAQVKEKDGTELSFHYELEPFGSLVLYLPPGEKEASRGEWLPKPAPEIQRPTDLPAPVAIHEAGQRLEPVPTGTKDWGTLAPGESIESRGIYGSHFLYYKIAASAGSMVTLEVPAGDAVIASASGSLLPATMDKDKKHFAFTLPPGAKELVALYENAGHANFGDKLGSPSGILSVKFGGGAPLAQAPLDDHSGLRFASGKVFQGDRAYGEAISNPGKSPGESAWKKVSIGRDASSTSPALLTWFRMGFELPQPKPGVWVPWHLHLEANGNGFIYVNGHCIGRYWQAGPQHDFFLPECWLNFGSGKANVVALDLRPVDKGVSIQSAAVAPYEKFAEQR